MKIVCILCDEDTDRELYGQDGAGRPLGLCASCASVGPSPAMIADAQGAVDLDRVRVDRIAGTITPAGRVARAQLNGPGGPALRKRIEQLLGPRVPRWRWIHASWSGGGGRTA